MVVLWNCEIGFRDLVEKNGCGDILSKEKNLKKFPERPLTHDLLRYLNAFNRPKYVWATC